MLYLRSKSLSPEATNLLLQYQNAVDTKASFTDKVNEGKRLFSQYNKKTNVAFKVIRETLAEMSGGTIRCNYCEDSNANQVEHIHPKNFYPDKCFSWENYCYACGPCNQPKSDRFAIFENSTGLEINFSDLPQNTQPPMGEALLINPRTESPLEFLFLDTSNTFKFVPFKESPKDIQRANYTIEILGLNSRSYLVKARKIAFDNFKSRLFEYVHKKESGASPGELKSLIESLKSEHHQTVWHEIIRQRSLHSEINSLFNRASEALTWT